VKFYAAGILLVIANVAACAATASSKQSTPTLSGQVKLHGVVVNRENGPAPYALVAAMSSDEQPMASTRCDGNGQFVFANLTTGDYSFVALSSPLQPAFAGRTPALPVDNLLRVRIVLDEASLLR
jgi:hypothetical protein